MSSKGRRRRHCSWQTGRFRRRLRTLILLMRKIIRIVRWYCSWLGIISRCGMMGLNDFFMVWWWDLRWDVGWGGRVVGLRFGLVSYLLEIFVGIKIKNFLGKMKFDVINDSKRRIIRKLSANGLLAAFWDLWCLRALSWSLPFRHQTLYGSCLLLEDHKWVASSWTLQSFASSSGLFCYRNLLSTCPGARNDWSCGTSWLC